MSNRVLLPGTGLSVYPLCLGGNVFGWTADEAESFAVLDAYAAAGGNFIDTADSYSVWKPGNVGGESEAIIGRWLAARGNRDAVVIATKVGRHPDHKGLSRANIKAQAEASLARLQVECIDLYYAHGDDPETPLEEAMSAFDELVREGKIRYAAASNYEAPRLREALATSGRLGGGGFAALQPHYNLLERQHYEDTLAPVCAEAGLGCLPYFALAHGFLTGKYRPGGPAVESARGESAGRYLDDQRAVGVLSTLDGVAAARGAGVASVALAWLRMQPTVVAPIASARTAEQLPALLASVDLTLDAAELEVLRAASDLP